ncbi:MAG: prolyl oligopeptidase family serine peptidase [Candidatus Hydrogenedens sp.]|nr:prolyl oligopeptidase family serine peptidase [Candidatus Hydrogenedens sp.]
MKRSAFAAVWMGLVVFAAVCAGAQPLDDAGFYADYDPNLPFNVESEGVKTVDKVDEIFGVERPMRFEKELFSFESREGERVPSIMARPIGSEGKKLPVILFLHGSGQKKEFIEEICTPFVEKGFAFASFDQFTRGKRQPNDNPWALMFSWRDRCWKTVNDARRMVDYLQTRDDVDPERIYLVGASYGAITGTTVIAREKRIKAGVLVVGGGDFMTMVNAPIIQEEVGKRGLDWALELVKPIAHLIVDAADPVHYAPGTEGTPVLMQSGSADRLVSPEAGEKLYAALGEPKEIRWYDVDHPGLREGDGPEIVRMLDEGLEWMLERDAPYRKAQTASGTSAETKPAG